MALKFFTSGLAISAGTSREKALKAFSGTKLNSSVSAEFSFKKSPFIFVKELITKRCQKMEKLTKMCHSLVSDGKVSHSLCIFRFL
jgi:hypothetical protein